MVKLFFIFFSLFINNIAAKSNDTPKYNHQKSNIEWNKWIENLKEDLQKSDFKVSTLKLLDNLKFNKKVIELDRKQPEFKLTFNEYVKNVISDKRVQTGKKKLNENKNLLNHIEKVYEVPKSLIVALWGIETSYGRHIGKFDVLNSLASLSYDGRRSAFFLKELKYSLKIIDNGDINRKSLKGSWAGAIGQTQFMPSTYINYAKDFNKDGKKDLLNDSSDALASGANYLSKMGWNINSGWGEQVKIKKITKEIEMLSINKTYKSSKFWNNLGIKLNNNYNNSSLRLIIPDNSSQKYFLVTKNYNVILNWNRSNYFALSVNILSDRIREK